MPVRCSAVSLKLYNVLISDVKSPLVFWVCNDFFQTPVRQRLNSTTIPGYGYFSPSSLLSGSDSLTQRVLTHTVLLDRDIFCECLQGGLLHWSMQ